MPVLDSMKASLASRRAVAHSARGVRTPTRWSRLTAGERAASAFVVALVFALIAGTGVTACRLGMALVQRGLR